MKEREYHPLLLKESQRQYDLAGKTPHLIEFECCNTIAGGLGACSYNIIKYKVREKDSDELDAKKKITFLEWRELLRDLLEAGYTYDTNLRFAMKSEYPNMKYTLEGKNNE